MFLDFFCILLGRTWFNAFRFEPNPFRPINSGDALHCFAKWIVENELNSEYGEMQHKKKKEKEKGKSNGDKRVVLEIFCNGNRGEQGWKFGKWQDFFKSEQWRPLGLFWEIFAIVNYLQVGEGERRMRPREKQIQIAFQETEFQSQFYVGLTVIKVWLISNQTLINNIFL